MCQIWSTWTGTQIKSSATDGSVRSPAASRNLYDELLPDPIACPYPHAFQALAQR